MNEEAQKAILSSISAALKKDPVTVQMQNKLIQIWDRIEIRGRVWIIETGASEFLKDPRVKEALESMIY